MQFDFVYGKWFPLKHLNKSVKWPKTSPARRLSAGLCRKEAVAFCASARIRHDTEDKRSSGWTTGVSSVPESYGVVFEDIHSFSTVARFLSVVCELQ